MTKKHIFSAILIIFSVLAGPALAEERCELPPDIDEGERYLMKFKDNKVGRYKILDVEDCWVKTLRADGNHRWWPVASIEFIHSKPEKE